MRALLSVILLLSGFASLAASGPKSQPPAVVPTESMTVVWSPDAPLLNEIESDEPPAEIAHAGELLWVDKPLPAMAMKWRAPMGNGTGEREGPMSEVRFTPGAAILYGFQVDLGRTVDVPSTKWLCEQIGRVKSLSEAARRQPCRLHLRRTRLPSGAIVAFVPCSSGPCPIALAREGKVTAIAVDAVLSARVVPGGKDGTLLLTTRWSRANGQWTGGALVPVGISAGSLKRLSDIPTDAIDARDAQKVASRDVMVEITQPVPGSSLVHVSGRRRDVRRADGHEFSSEPIDERRSIP